MATCAAASTQIKKKKITQPDDPNAEVIALSPKTLMATNRFTCEVCKKGFQREQNLQLHKRGHNLPWEYTCDCGTLFSRRDSFMTHRAFCNAIAQENGTNYPTNLCDIITSQLLGSSRANNGDGFRSFSSLLPQLSGSDFIPASTHVNVLGCSHGRDQAHLVPNKLIYNGPVQELSHDQIPSEELLTDHSFFSNTARKDYHCESPIDDSHSNNSASTHLSSSNLFAKKFERSEVGGSSLISSGHQGLSSAGLFSSTESFMCDNPISLSFYSSAASSLQNSNASSASHQRILSATALLQKAAQVSSSRSINGSGSLLRTLGSSFSSSMHPSPHNLFNASIGGCDHRLINKRLSWRWTNSKTDE